MLKITSNHNKKDINYSFTLGQSFPKVEGKLLAIEVNGHELSKLLEVYQIPLFSISNPYIMWNGKFAGRILKTFQELLLK